MTAATARAGVEVQYRATGVEAVKRAGREVTSSADQMQQRVGGASRQIAGAVEQIARQGKLTGEALKQVAAQGAEMAFMFGPQGAIAGAIGVLGVAMFSFWDRTRREMEETRRKGIEELQQLAQGGNLVGASSYAQRLFSGDPFAMRGAIEGETDAGFLARSRGLQGVRGRLAELRRDPILMALVGANGASGSQGGGKLGAEFRELVRLETQLTQQHKTAIPIVNALAEAEARRLQNIRAFTGGGTGTSAGGMALPGLGGPQSMTYRRTSNAVTGGIKVPNATNIADVIANDETAQQIKAGAERLAAVAQINISATIGEGLYNGFARAFSGEGIKGLIAGFGQTVLGAIGSLFQRMGMAYLEFGKIMDLSKLLFNPATAGFAGIALGVALMALGGALQGLAGGRGGGGMGGGYSAASTATTSVIDRGLINPLNPLGSTVTPRNPVTVNATIIGPNDPTAQRGIRELIRNAQARGSM